MKSSQAAITAAQTILVAGDPHEAKDPHKEDDHAAVGTKEHNNRHIPTSTSTFATSEMETTTTPPVAHNDTLSHSHGDDQKNND